MVAMSGGDGVVLGLKFSVVVWHAGDWSSAYADEHIQQCGCLLAQMRFSKAAIEDGESLVAVAAVTKCEATLCLAMLRESKTPSSRTAGRIADYTSELTAELHEDWSGRLHASIVALAKDILKASAAAVTVPGS